MASNASQAQAPLATAVDRVLASRDIFPFTTPGHKRSSKLADPLLALDLPLATGADDGHLSGGVLQKAEALAADLWGAERCRFSVNGSTHANQALALAVGRPGDRVLVARNLHKSLLMGLVFAGLDPVWIHPSVDPRTGLALTVPAAEIARALTDAPDARAVFLVEPSFFGVVGDISRAAELAHGAGIPLIVDQAWGSHFGFHPDVPPAAISQGADAQVVSTHKTLAAFTQSALLLARSGFLDLDRLDEAFDALNTTSPSAAIYGSVDRMRRRMASEGEDLVAEAVRLAGLAQREIAAIDGVEVFRDRVARDHGHLAYDPTKLVISLAGTGADGLDVERDIWNAGVRLELADRDTLVPLVTVGDDDRAIDRLTQLDRRLHRDPSRRSPAAEPRGLHPIPARDGRDAPRRVLRRPRDHPRERRARPHLGRGGRALSAWHSRDRPRRANRGRGRRRPPGRRPPRHPDRVLPVTQPGHHPGHTGMTRSHTLTVN